METPAAACASDLYANGFVPRPSWVDAEFADRHGHLRIHATGVRLHIEAVDSATGEVHDELVLTRQHGGGTWAGAAQTRAVY